MLIAFLESIRYVGHLYPVAVLRIFFGYHFLSLSFERLENQFLVQPRLAARIMNYLPEADLPTWYSDAIQTIVVPNWQIFAHALVYAQLAIGFSLLLGFLVRPATLIGILMSLNAILIGGPSSLLLNQMFLAVFVVLFWLGAGRCLGFDYFFYKRQRGIWW